MKIVFCGPPHSGKTVFIANLIDKMPTNAYTIIRACPDGEGTWSNNKNQKEIEIVRKKGKFTDSFINNACQAIDNQTNEIVLVDVGGVISKENKQVFQHCDSFVVLSNNEEKKNEWLQFGQSLGLDCVGCIDSRLEGQEEIYSKEPYLQGKIVGLKRGELLNKSTVIESLVSDIIQKSKYAEKDEIQHKDIKETMIDDTELGFELGYGKELITEDGTAIKKVKWTSEALPQIYKNIQTKIKSNQPIKINGVRANFVLGAICKALKQQGAKDVSIYDARKSEYIPIKEITKKKGLKQTEGLAYNIIENKENLFMDIDLTKEQYSLEDYEKCVLPEIKENKNLYLSGRMTHWLLASIINSYDSNKIFTFQPGNGFTCIYSNNEKDIGKIVDGADGININQYFNDKKTKTKALAIKEEQGIISKIKKIFANIKENKEKMRYLDDTIKSNIIYPTEPISNEKKAFQVELPKETNEETKSKKQEKSLNATTRDDGISKN